MNKDEGSGSEVDYHSDQTIDACVLRELKGTQGIHSEGLLILIWLMISEFLVNPKHKRLEDVLR